MSSGELPSSLWIQHVVVDKDVFGFGGEVLVYLGDFKGQKVVVRKVHPSRSTGTTSVGQDPIKVGKLLRFVIIIYSPETDHQLLHREVITHSLLKHPNIIPFLGVYRASRNEPPAIVLPYAENGSLGKFITNNTVTSTLFAKIVRIAPPIDYWRVHSNFIFSSNDRFLESRERLYTFTQGNPPYIMEIFIGCDC